jgi:hypothetical protein
MTDGLLTSYRPCLLGVPKSDQSLAGRASRVRGRRCWRSKLDEPVADRARTGQPDAVGGRLHEPTPVEVARTALWLIANTASYVTGAQLAAYRRLLVRAAISA